MAYKPEDDNAGVISPNLYATPMRNLTENKGLLHKKGMLYAGTGTSKEFVCGVNEDGSDKKITVPVTTAIDPSPSDVPEGSVLIKDSTQAGGWKVGQIETAGIKDGAITEAKLSKEYYIKNNSIDFTADRLTGALPHISWSKQSNITGRPSTLTLQAPLQSAERTTTILNLPITNSMNTLATKEQIENGDIIAKTAQTTDFSNAEWIRVDGEDAASVVEGGVYQIRVEAKNYNYVEGIATMKKPSTQSLSTVCLGVHFGPSGSSVLLIDEYVMNFNHTAGTMSMREITTNIDLSTSTIKIVGSFPVTTYWEYRRIR